MCWCRNLVVDHDLPADYDDSDLNHHYNDHHYNDHHHVAAIKWSQRDG